MWVPDAEQRCATSFERVTRRSETSSAIGMGWGSHSSHQEVFIDYLNEVRRAKQRIERLEKAIVAGSARALKRLQELIAALQALRGVAKIGAATYDPAT